MEFPVTLQTQTEAETQALAASIGKRLKGGEVIELVSDLGGGKTSFVRGLASGAGSLDHVRSPSFTLQNEYRAGDLTIHHLDFYRLNDAGIMRRTLNELTNDPFAVIAIDWADIVEDILPTNRLRIEILASGEQERQFKISGPVGLSYLLK